MFPRFHRFPAVRHAACAFALLLGSAMPAAAQVFVDGRLLTPPSPDAKPLKATEMPRFRDDLRGLVEGLAQYAEARDPKFILIGREPLGLMETSAWETQLNSLLDKTYLDRDPVPDDAPGGPFRRILKDFDAVALDDVNCPKPKPAPDAKPPTQAELKKAEDRDKRIAAIRKLGTPILSLDACTVSPYDLARKGRRGHALSVFAVGSPDAPKTLPRQRPPFENSDAVNTLADVRNAYWLRSPRGYGAKAEWLEAMTKSNADLLIVGAFYTADKPLTKADVHAMQYKFMGPRRLVLAEINLTTARDDRFYWKREWRIGETPFLREALPNPADGVLVNYWLPEWKKILGDYFVGLMDLGFDGVLIDGLNAADRFEYELILE